MKIAVLITVFNRRDKTLRCLESLSKQKLASNVEIKTFVTDDNSTDGTSAAIKIFYPEVELFKGSGFLYWAGGMRFTFEHSLHYAADYYLLLNDDTVLYENAINILLQGIQQNAIQPAICIGSTKDKESQQISYGGRKLTHLKKWKSNIVYSNNECVKCDFGNANIMLISKKIIDKIGFLSNDYTHSLADYDYTLTAKKAGFELLVAPGFLGECKDDHGNNWKPGNISLKERIKYLKSPTGLAYREYLIFIKKHFPLSYPSSIAKLWLKTYFPFIWDSLKK